MVRVAINGFGRIGRTILRLGIKNPNIEFVAINDLTDTKTLSHLLKYDSVYRTFDSKVGYTDKSIIIDNKEITVFAEKDPAKLPWKTLNIDIVLECTGFFTDKEGCEKHIMAGAKKVLLSAPSKNDGFFTMVKGVNEHKYDKKKDNLVSNGSCTTNCLLPVLKVLNDNYKIAKGYFTTVHAYTSTQKLVDSPDKDLRRARAAACNIIPTSTGASKTLERAIPELKGKIDGFALRVPVLCGSITDITCEVEKEVTVEELNKLFKNVSEYHLKGVLEYTDAPIVSSDVLGNCHSVVFDSALTKVVDKHLVKVVGWYDNEYGFCCRMIDVILLM